MRTIVITRKGGGVKKRDNWLMWAVQHKKQGRLPLSERRQLREMYRRVYGVPIAVQKALRYV
jgi:hypothetical protein